MAVVCDGPSSDGGRLFLTGLLVGEDEVGWERQIWARRPSTSFMPFLILRPSKEERLSNATERSASIVTVVVVCLGGGEVLARLLSIDVLEGEDGSRGYRGQDDFCLCTITPY